MPSDQYSFPLPLTIAPPPGAILLRPISLYEASITPLSIHLLPPCCFVSLLSLFACYRRRFAARVRNTVPLVRIAVTASIVPRAAVAVVSAPPPGAKPSAFISLGIAWLVVKLQDLIGYHVLK